MYGVTFDLRWSCLIQLYGVFCDMVRNVLLFMVLFMVLFMISFMVLFVALFMAIYGVMRVSFLGYFVPEIFVGQNACAAGDYECIIRSGIERCYGLLPSSSIFNEPIHASLAFFKLNINLEELCHRHSPRAI